MTPRHPRLSALGPRSAAAPRRGFALVTALWLTVAVAAVSLELSLLARGRRVAAANVLDASRGRAAAEAGLETAKARLARLLPDTAAPDPWAGLDGRVDSIVVGDVAARVTLTDLGARLHVNRATPAELQRLFAAIGVDAADAAALAQRIADWRDGDELPRASGAERADYLRAGAAVLPRDGDLREVEELRHVAGVTPVLLARLRPLLAVDGSGRVNVNAAPRAVLLALPGMTPSAVEAVERVRRAGGRVADLADLRDRLSPPARRAVDRELAALAGRLVFETREVLARGVGGAQGSPVRIAASVVLSRGASSVVATARTVGWEGEP